MRAKKVNLSVRLANSDSVSRVRTSAPSRAAAAQSQGAAFHYEHHIYTDAVHSTRVPCITDCVCVFKDSRSRTVRNNAGRCGGDAVARSLSDLATASGLWLNSSKRTIFETFHKWRRQWWQRECAHGPVTTRCCGRRPCSSRSTGSSATSCQSGSSVCGSDVTSSRHSCDFVSKCF